MKKDRGFVFQSFMEMWNVYPFTRQKSQTQTWCIQISFSARWLQKRWGPHLCIYYLVFSVRWRLSATLCAWRVEADSEPLVTEGFICCMWAMARLLGSGLSYSPQRLLLSEENLRGLFTDPLLPLISDFQGYIRLLKGCLSKPLPLLSDIMRVFGLFCYKLLWNAYLTSNLNYLTSI